MTKNKNNKRRGRPPKYDMPERIDASPEEIAEVVLQAKPKEGNYMLVYQKLLTSPTVSGTLTP